jgi:UDP-glucose 4-epimerase
MDHSFYCSRRVVVTGGAGFIGSHLVETLVAAGAHVQVVDSLAQGRKENLAAVLSGVNFRRVDVRDGEALQNAMRDAEVVFHLAANASVPRSVEDPEGDFACNAVGTLNLLQAIRANGAGRCVLASSGAVYGQPRSFPIREGHPLLPISPYGASKAAAEALCRAFHSSYGIPVQIARIFNTYGARQPRFVMYDFYRKLRQDPSRLEILGDGKQIRDFCFVSDTVDALLRIGQLGGGGCEAFNISSGKSYSVVELAEAMCDLMGLRGVKFSFAAQSWAGDAQQWEVGIKKIRKATGFEPQYDLRTGLRAFIEWFDQHPERLVRS